MSFSLRAGVTFLWAGLASATLLFGGGQEILFEDASSDCLAAFDTTLNCDANIQLLSYDMVKLGFNESQLTSLCTSDCKSSLLTLNTSVVSACGDYEFEFNDGFLSAVQVVDLYIYKYDMFCLVDSASNDFCQTVEASWNIRALEAAGNATWPAYTNKTFPDWFSDPEYGEPAMDIDGTLIDNSNEMSPFQDVRANLSLPWSASDYFNEGIESGWEGHGWPSMLEYDEYPLEIQCSECFLAQYKLGLESQWGEQFDEVSSQVWDNIKSNCNLDWELKPAHNISTGVLSGIGTLVWQASVTCDQNITRDNTDNTTYTCDDLSYLYGIPSTSFQAMNDPFCPNVDAGTYCLPQSCDVAIANDTMDPRSFLEQYDNITYTQFVSWNKYVNHRVLIKGEVVCIGPPGGAYIPSATTGGGDPSVYTTTATPSDPTASGTIANCGKYASVSSGDSCNTIVLAAGITLDEFYSMNPSVDTDCSNLFAGYDYCVALVNGTTVTSAASGTASAAASATSFAAAPTNTVAGTTSECYKWYVTQSGDNCYNIYTANDLTLDEFRALNTYIDKDCSNLWVGYAYCVKGIAESASSTVAAASATATS